MADEGQGCSLFDVFRGVAKKERFATVFHGQKSQWFSSHKNRAEFFSSR